MEIPTVSELYSLYGKKVFTIAYRMTGDRALAEDILQEVFILVLKNRERFRGESAIYTWIYTIAKNECLRVKRRSFQSFERLVETEPAAAPPGLDDRQKRVYVEEVKDGCLTGLLQCLPFHQRIAFIFNVLFEVPVSVCAAALGKTENSIRILVSRAKSGLKRFLCRSCSLYDRKNPCRCENMIGFSLKHSLIPAWNARASAAAVQSELGELKSEVLLYRTLPGKDAPERFLSRLLERKDLSILSRKKVK